MTMVPFRIDRTKKIRTEEEKETANINYCKKCCEQAKKRTEKLAQKKKLARESLEYFQPKKYKL